MRWFTDLFKRPVSAPLAETIPPEWIRPTVVPAPARIEPILAVDTDSLAVASLAGLRQSTVTRPVRKNVAPIISDGQYSGDALLKLMR